MEHELYDESKHKSRISTLFGKLIAYSCRRFSAHPLLFAELGFQLPSSFHSNQTLRINIKQNLMTRCYINIIKT